MHNCSALKQHCVSGTVKHKKAFLFLWILKLRYTHSQLIGCQDIKQEQRLSELSAFENVQLNEH